MKRLTYFDGEFWVHKNFPPVEENRVDEFIDCVKELAARLAAIEDILGDEYDLERLRELARADRDGKLPKYTIGDIIYDRFGMAWTVDSLEYVQCTYEKKWLYRCGHPGTDDYRGLYQDEVLTRAEAEAALRREQE